MVPEIQTSKKNRLFALVLTQHRIWGQILVPYIITKQPDSSFWKLGECLSPFPNSDTLSMLNDEERETVRTINEYTDRNLFKLFSREKNVKEFTEKVTEERVAKFIRPFIEKRIFRCMIISRDEDIPVFARRMKSASLHEDDRLMHADENARPVFIFIRDPEQTTYNLCLESGGKKMNLRDSPTDILCMEPCVIRQEQFIFLVSDIDGSKLKPFLTKEFVIVQKKNELQYFKTFVLNAVNNFKVEGKGFTIVQIEPEKQVFLEVDEGIKGFPVLILKYGYEGKKIYANDTAKGFTLFDSQNGSFVFRKFVRDYDWEKRCRDILGECGFFSDDEVNFSNEPDPRKKRDDLHSLVESINNSYEILKNSGFIFSSRLGKNFNLQRVSIGMSSELVNDWFDLKAVVTIGEWKIPFSMFRKNILNDIREYALPDGSIAVLPEAWFTKYRSLFELGISSGEKLRIHKQHFSLLADTMAEEPSGYEKLQKLLIPGEVPIVSVPGGLVSELRKYQQEGLNWLSFLQNAGLGGCLADDMGLGKTIQALALLQHNKENIKAGSGAGITAEPDLFSSVETKLTSLIIVPASLVYNWENEIRRFVPEMSVYSYKGVHRRKSASYFNQFDIILSSYHTVRQDIDIISQFRFHYIILDESQVIKNPGSMLYRSFTRLSSDYKMVLTGTPVENSLTDLWTQLNFVNPGLLGELSFFIREFAKPIEKLGDDEKESRLKKIIQPFILRRTKEMVARDLPPVTEQVVYCDMTEEQEKLYEEEKSVVRNSLLTPEDSIEKSAILVLQGLMKLRQISNHPLMAYDDYQSGSGKFDTVMQYMESVILEGHKILVFSSFVRHLDLFAAELTRKRIGYAMLTGASINRQKIVNSFQNENDKKIFLISLKAGGVGLNLTAADYVFILDPWWNPASEMQALSRAHRIGQDKSVFVYRYITSNSIEEKIIRLQEKKSKLAETFITSNNPLKDINVEEILGLLG